MGSRFLLLLVLLCAACSEERGRPAVVAAPAAGVDRDTWWTTATQRPSGKERILAPRELRALLAEGRERGYDGDQDWWSERAKWAYGRILSVDAEDVEANAGMGRKTLQTLPGFARIWKRMLLADPTDEISALLDRYEVWVRDGRPIFLTGDEYEILQARLRRIEEHLDRVDSDPAYAALQRALRRVKNGPLGDYPYIHVQAGPFLVFFTARDLQRVPGEPDASEDARLSERREYYRRRLEMWTPVYAELLKDIADLYPAVWAKHPLEPNAIFYQWVFGERSWYEEFKERLHKENPERPYRAGWFSAANGWAYLYRPAVEAPPAERQVGEEEPPPADDPVAVLRETAAYLGATQLMRHWARGPEVYSDNHLDLSRAYWLKEGWPAFLAARRVEKPRVGRVFQWKWTMPSLQSVVERRSHLWRSTNYLTSSGDDVDWALHLPPDQGYTDLAWLLVRHLSGEKTRARFETFLISQIEGTHHGPEWFEECFGVKGMAGWNSLQRAAYAYATDK